MNEIFKRQPDESVQEYKERIYTLKKEHRVKLTWDIVSKLFAHEIGELYSPSKWRREYNNWP